MNLNLPADPNFVAVAKSHQILDHKILSEPEQAMQPEDFNSSLAAQPGITVHLVKSATLFTYTRRQNQAFHG